MTDAPSPRCSSGSAELLALADEYEAGLKKMLASGYEEFGPDVLRKHRMTIDALRFQASATLVTRAELPLAVRLRDEEGPLLPQMIAQRRAALSPQAQAGGVAQPSSGTDDHEATDLAELLRRVRERSIDAEADIIEMFNERRKEIEALRHDIDRHIQIATDTLNGVAQEVKERPDDNTVHQAIASAGHASGRPRRRDKMTEHKYLGNFAACEPWAAQGMSCDDCMVSWTGCWDNFQCPKCGKGELPSCDLSIEGRVHLDVTCHLPEDF